MGSTPSPQFGECLLQLVLRSQTADPLIRNDDDVEALGHIATRMLFWCGGAIYAWRSEGNEMRFALQVKHAPLGSMAHHISGPYANHMRQTRKLTGSIFKHYAVVPLHEDCYLDDLVLWLHRPAEHSRLWTADDAYLTPHSLSWIDTERILSALSPGSPVPATYRRRKLDPIPPAELQEFNRRPRRSLRDSRLAKRPNIERIARLVADRSGVTYEDMLADTRKRAVSKARVIATVLSTRNGATAAAASRLFNRSRSTLIEQVEHYRIAQPDIFTEAEQWLDALLAERPDDSRE
jgi:hypothetical protein